jgi:hypothetical protein
MVVVSIVDGASTLEELLEELIEDGNSCMMEELDEVKSAADVLEMVALGVEEGVCELIGSSAHFPKGD